MVNGDMLMNKTPEQASFHKEWIAITVIAVLFFNCFGIQIESSIILILLMVFIATHLKNF